MDFNDSDDIWDDSALIVSWDSALEEYKKYHSILARGGSIGELRDLLGSRKTKPVDDAASADDVDQEVDDVTSQDESNEPIVEAESDTPDVVKPGAEGAEGAAVPTTPPQEVLGSMQDENLKKLLMSWYYAGYYTGLYEGQHQQVSNQPQ